MLNSIKNFFSLSENSNRDQDISNKNMQEEYLNLKISNKLEQNRKYINNIFDKCTDLIIRELKITSSSKFSAILVYIDNMIETTIFEESIIERLINKKVESSYPPNSKEYSQYLLGISDTNICQDISIVVNSILDGKVVLFVDGINEAIIIDINNPPGRDVEEPQSETVLRGPREGFTESIGSNITLLRKKIKSANFKIEEFRIGRATKTKVTIVYLSNKANSKIVNEVKERIGKIDIDSVLESNYIKEYIGDEPTSNFPTVYSTEKPDVIAGKLLEGRVAILTDGTPIVLTVPSLFIEFFLNNEDYYLNFVAATLNRWIRYIAFVISIILPGFYVAITTFHPELIPSSLIVSLIKSRAGVPYPALIECLLMLSVYELLREAGIRMPRALGQTISVVGALVLGQAAVEAGLASTPMVIVISLTALSSFALPSTDMSLALTYPRIVFLVFGGTMGLVGLTCGMIILFLRLTSLRSYGIPYLSPMAPIQGKKLTDIFIRSPLLTKLKKSWVIKGKKTTRR
ncbi:spore germination protein [Clostridium estertheticum]|uniref:spore germination protein n=1 Tax=Clostridium estertheticum TaxID=238834 RepID=UPI001C0D11BC|nr:spore germination protein [Clostridium estertheticum]MBU3218110.1 spore germination protein [Clostridium estertheticum]WAG55277.1 spore germination protein [Clostridium estertheticum]